MATRAIVALYGAAIENPVLLYRHYDGYPANVAEDLEWFCKHIRDGVIRNNGSQAAGWLVLRGSRHNVLAEHVGRSFEVDLDCPSGEESDRWKASLYEPITCVPTDIEYLHVVDVARGVWGSLNPWEEARARSLGEAELHAELAYIKARESAAALQALAAARRATKAVVLCRGRRLAESIAAPGEALADTVAPQP